MPTARSLSNLAAAAACITAHTALAGAPTSVAAADHIITGAPGEELAFRIAYLGDLNNDGRDEFILGAPRNNTNGPSAGRAIVYDGATLTPLHTDLGESGGDEFGAALGPIGDINNDGTPDFAVGAPLSNAGGIDSGRAYLYSGADGSLIDTLTGAAANDRFGSAISPIGRLNEDDHDDFAISAPFSSVSATLAGRVYIYSGADRSIITTLDGAEVGDSYGHALAAVGDIDGDTFPDLCVGTHLQNNEFGVNAGLVTIESIALATVIRDRTGMSIGELFGVSVANAGLVDGDAIPDIIVGAINRDVATPYLDNYGSAFVISGADASVIHEFNGERQGDTLGRWVSSAGDINHDGTPDILVGASGHDGGAAHPGRAYLYCGATGNRIALYEGEAGQDRLGICVAGNGDINGD
ncbi:MAG: integrin alpha, partial [Planctomycetota bacterium]|nr:integrin alpha [Planctomycetota bacterium]